VRGGVGRGRQAGLGLVTGLALFAASTALAGVFVGVGWLGYVALSTAVVVAVGIGLRSLHAGPVVTVAGQLAGLLVLSVALFSDLGALLHGATVEIHEEIAPVRADPPLLLFCVVSLGLAAVLLDTLVGTARMPAAGGLVLASIYAVSALLDDAILPWWSFAAGAAGFSLLLVTARDAGARSAGSPRLRARGAGGIGLAGLTALGVLAALLVAGAAGPIGTVNRFSPAGGGDAPGEAPQEVGLRPMTRLRGMLDESRTPRTLFRVRGLGGHDRYLRALTLSHYSAGLGWTRTTDQASGVPVRSGDVLAHRDANHSGQPAHLRIAPVHWRDYWLPVFGVPWAVGHVGMRYRYDPATGVIASRHRRRPPVYTEAALLAQPSADELRDAGRDFSGVPREYLQLPRISPRIRRLTRRVTSSAHTEFGRAKSIWEYFTDGAHGFSYSLSTAPKISPNALADFLFHGKRGFCEQYASAMAVMLRSIGIPSRVAVGFTPGLAGGRQAAGTRTITSRDAHAWVEVFFPGYGWQTFDPTPLTDGRGSVPRYLVATPETTTGPAGAADPDVGRPDPGGDSSAGPQHRAPAQHDAAPALRSPATPLPWWAVLVLALGGLLGMVSVPALVRTYRRRGRIRVVRAGGAGAAAAAWRELADSAADHGEGDSGYETLRATAGRWSAVHALDEHGREGLRVIVEALERALYGPGGVTRDAPTELTAALDTVRRSLARNAPMRYREVWLPRSVLRFRCQARATAHRDEHDEHEAVG
jgi:hypothetical protein